MNDNLNLNQFVVKDRDDLTVNTFSGVPFGFLPSMVTFEGKDELASKNTRDIFSIAKEDIISIETTFQTAYNAERNDLGEASISSIEDFRNHYCIINTKKQNNGVLGHLLVPGRDVLGEFCTTKPVGGKEGKAAFDYDPNSLEGGQGSKVYKVTEVEGFIAIFYRSVIQKGDIKSSIPGTYAYQRVYYEGRVILPNKDELEVGKWVSKVLLIRPTYIVGSYEDITLGGRRPQPFFVPGKKEAADGTHEVLKVQPDSAAIAHGGMDTIRTKKSKEIDQILLAEPAVFPEVSSTLPIYHNKLAVLKAKIVELAQQYHGIVQQQNPANVPGFQTNAPAAAAIAVAAAPPGPPGPPVTNIPAPPAVAVAPPGPPVATAPVTNVAPVAVAPPGPPGPPGPPVTNIPAPAAAAVAPPGPTVATAAPVTNVTPVAAAAVAPPGPPVINTPASAAVAPPGPPGPPAPTKVAPVAAAITPLIITENDNYATFIKTTTPDKLIECMIQWGIPFNPASFESNPDGSPTVNGVTEMRMYTNKMLREALKTNQPQ
jgi:hypothetical protein